MEKEMSLTQKQSERTNASALLDADMQDVRQFLREVRHGYLHAQMLCERAERYREMAMRATSRIDAIRTSGTPGRSKVETYVLEMIDVHDELQKEMESVLDRSRRAEKLIGLVQDDRYRAVLQFRYLCGMRWEEIAQKLMFTLRWTHKLHRNALDELERLCRRKRSVNGPVEKEDIVIH